MTQNSFPLTKWHEEHMEKLIIRYVTGLPADASNWQKRMNKKYGKQPNIIKNIKYDIKHGANKSQVLALFLRIRQESFFHYLQINKESMDRVLSEAISNKYVYLRYGNQMLFFLEHFLTNSISHWSISVMFLSFCLLFACRSPINV